MTYLALTAQECDTVIYIHCYCLACLTKKEEGGGAGTAVATQYSRSTRTPANVSVEAV